MEELVHATMAGSVAAELCAVAQDSEEGLSSVDCATNPHPAVHYFVILEICMPGDPARLEGGSILSPQRKPLY